MATRPILAPFPALARELARRGGATAARCFQCATCSGVCELAPDEAPFPRRQVLLAQWGRLDDLAADPAVWLCHRCNDCTVRCPRDARPGDVMAAVRALVVERLAVPRWLGRLVGAARVTWPLLLGVPVAFWLALLALTGHLAVPEPLVAYEQVVPHRLVYAVFLPVSALVLAATWVSARRFWRLLGSSGPPRRGSFLAALPPVLAEIVTHRRFASCEAARARRLGHLALLLGFVGAAVVSGLLVVALYGFHVRLPLPLGHPLKILGNLAALLLVVGVAVLAAERVARPEAGGRSTAFDTFFLAVVALVVLTGAGAEAGRLLLPAPLAVAVYVVHLAAVLTLFVTFPYSKFAHLLYRTLAMVHERMTR